MSGKRIEILEGKILMKGALYAKIKIYVASWDLEIREVLVFKKGTEVWFNLPSKEFQDEDGQKKYMYYMRFGKSETHAGFQKVLRAEFDIWLAENEDKLMEAQQEKEVYEELHTPPDEEMPF